MMMSISDINNITNEVFIETFQNIIEYTPEAAHAIIKHRPFKNVDDIFNSIDMFLNNLDKNEKLRILKLHPDLSGKLCNNLTTESVDEQKSAGLDDINNEQKEQLQILNEKYKKKFQFPFVICAKENKIQTIFQAMELRLKNNLESELFAGIEEVKKISKHRIRLIVKDN